MCVSLTSYEPVVWSILSHYTETKGDEWHDRSRNVRLLSSLRKWQLIECTSIVIFCSLADELELGKQREIYDVRRTVSAENGYEAFQ